MNEQAAGRRFAVVVEVHAVLGAGIEVEELAGPKDLVVGDRRILSLHVKGFVVTPTRTVAEADRSAFVGGGT